MRRIKCLVAIFFSIVLFIGIAFNPLAVEYVVYADNSENDLEVHESVTQDIGEDVGKQEDSRICVDGQFYTGYCMDTDGIMYIVSEGIKGSAVNDILADGTNYYNCGVNTMEELIGTFVYIEGKVYNGYYMGSDKRMYKASAGTVNPVSYTVLKGQTYYNYGDSRTLTLAKNTVYVCGNLYSGYYMSGNGKMYKVSAGMATPVSYTVSKGQTYYSCGDGTTLTLKKNTVYIGGNLYSGYYTASNGKMYKVTKGTSSLARGIISKGKSYYNYKKGKTIKISKATAYLNGKLYSGYYLSSTGKMYKVKKGACKLVSATLSKGTKYYSYNAAKTLKLGKKTVYVKGNNANVWAKIKGTWCYYDASGKAKFKSNTMYNAWKKIKSKSSKTKYFVVVDTSKTKTMIFKGSKGKWVPFKLWSCSPGKSSTPTVKGTYTVKAKGYSFGRGYTCYYYTQFYGDYLFHSVLYRQGTFKIMDGRLGQKLSHGCVRLSLGNAKWMYKNIPRNTKVYIY